MTTTDTTDARIAELEADLRDLRALTAESHPGVWRMQDKIDRQRRALDLLTRRNTNLRFALRLVESLGRGVTHDEWVAARDAMTNEQHQARIGDTVPSAA